MPFMKADKSSAWLAAWSAAAASLLLLSTVSGQAADAQAQVIPLITMESVNLTDAIKNLARQAGLNYLLDPSLSEPLVGPDGKVIPPPVVTARFENTTAKDALLEVLKKHDLQMVETPVTKVWRIDRTGRVTSPVDPKWVAADTNTIPLIAMDSVPLDAALQNLARQAQLNIAVDPAVSRPTLVPGGRPAMPSMVSVRLEGITARQAIAALVENYDLTLSADAASGAVSIAPRRKADEAPAGSKQGGGPGQ